MQEGNKLPSLGGVDTRRRPRRSSHSAGRQAGGQGGEMAAGPDKVYRGPALHTGSEDHFPTGTGTHAGGGLPDEAAAALEWRLLTQ